MITDKAKDKVKILSFREKHGIEATLDAFSVKRLTLFSWKKTLKENKGKLESLNDKSKAPHKKRQRIIQERFNRTIQEEFINWYQQTLAYDLNKFNYLLMDWLIWYNT